MAKTQYYTAASIDGFIAGPGNWMDWLFQVGPGPDTEGRFHAFFSGVGAMAMGATTYEWSVQHGGLGEPGSWQRYYGDTPCWVFTHRQLPEVPGARIVFTGADVREVHAQLSEAADGRNIWLVGGGELVGQFADYGLLDEIQLGIAASAARWRHAAAPPAAARRRPEPGQGGERYTLRVPDLHGARQRLRVASQPGR